VPRDSSNAGKRSGSGARALGSNAVVFGSNKDVVSVVVPASSANVGCAFDCAAIALSLYLRASASAKTGSASESPFEVSYQGANADQVPRDADNLILRAMQRAAAARNKTLPSLRLDVRNEIPLGVGLGSSAAAIVAGVLLGSELRGVKLTPAELLRLAVEIEGHPDNVAAALHGGFVVAAMPEEAPDTGDIADILVAKAKVPTNIEFVAVIPEVPLPTQKARAALPAQYSRRDVVANLQRTALLTATFFSGGELSPELFRDKLHQPYRGPLVPGIAECLAFRHAGLAGVFLSGAGSAVMAIARHSATEIGDALVGEFRRKGTAARVQILKADNRGAQTSSAGLPAAKGARPLQSRQKTNKRSSK
jgi:homoserine kinase